MMRKRKWVRHDPQRVMRFIVDFKRDHDGNSPTVQEICEGCGIGSKSVAVYILDRLEEDGRIERTGKARMIMVTGGEWHYVPDALG